MITQNKTCPICGFRFSGHWLLANSERLCIWCWRWAFSTYQVLNSGNSKIVKERKAGNVQK
jgi:hypothetical protein